MPRRLIRGSFALLVLAGFWLLLLGWAAGIEPGDPWAAAAQKAFPGGQAKPVFGAAQPAGNALRITKLSDGGTALQAWRMHEALDAETFQLLHYEIAELPRDLEVAFFFRRADKPQQVFSVPLPMPADGVGAIELERIADWRAQIVEIGLSQYPKAEALHQEVLSDPFSVHGLRLEGRSWQGLLQALFTGWWSFSPWDQRSINALDPVAEPLAPTSVVLVIAAGAAGSGVLLLGIFGWRGDSRRRWQLLFAVLGAAWLLLDARWLAAMATRHQDVTAAYAGLGLPERTKLQADADLVAFAARVRATVVGKPARQRVLLWSESRFVIGRLGYHLRPLNVANLSQVSRPQEGWFLILEDPQDTWHYDSSSGQLRGPGRELRADRLFAEGALALYRLRGGT